MQEPGPFTSGVRNLEGSSSSAQRMQESVTLDPGSFLFPGPETNDGRSLLRISGLKKKKKRKKLTNLVWSRENRNPTA